MPFKDLPCDTEDWTLWEIEISGKSFHDGNEWSQPDKRKQVPEERYFYIWSTSKTNFQLIPASDPNHKNRFSISKKQAKIIRRVRKEGGSK